MLNALVHHWSYKWRSCWRFQHADLSQSCLVTLLFLLHHTHKKLSQSSQPRFPLCSPLIVGSRYGGLFSRVRRWALSCEGKRAVDSWVGLGWVGLGYWAWGRLKSRRLHCLKAYITIKGLMLPSIYIRTSDVGHHSGYKYHEWHRLFKVLFVCSICRASVKVFLIPGNIHPFQPTISPDIFSLKIYLCIGLFVKDIFFLNCQPADWRNGVLDSVFKGHKIWWWLTVVMCILWVWTPNGTLCPVLPQERLGRL